MTELETDCKHVKTVDPGRRRTASGVADAAGFFSFSHFPAAVRPLPPH